MTTDKLKIKVYLIDKTEYVTPMNLKFPKDWTYNQRETLVKQMALVLDQEIIISEYDEKAYFTGVDNNGFHNIEEEIDEHIYNTREEWDAWNFHQERGDV